MDNSSENPQPQEVLQPEKESPSENLKGTNNKRILFIYFGIAGFLILAGLLIFLTVPFFQKKGPQLSLNNDKKAQNRPVAQQETEKTPLLSSPASKSASWSHYLNFDRYPLGCQGTLSLLRGGHIPVHPDEFARNATYQDQYADEGTILPNDGIMTTILDTHSHILHISASAGQKGDLGYFQIHDNADHTKPPLVEKKTYEGSVQFDWNYGKEFEEKVVSGKLYADFHFARFTLRGFEKAGSPSSDYYLNGLTKCLANVPMPYIVALSPSTLEKWKQGEKRTIAWEVHYPPGSDFNKYHLVTTLYLTGEDGINAGSITYEGGASEGKNSFIWNINNRVPLMSKTKTYKISLILRDDSNVLPPRGVYDEQEIRDISIENDPTVTSTNM